MSVTKMMVQNMAEDAIFMIGSPMANEFISDLLNEHFPPETDDKGRPVHNVSRELIQGAGSFLVMHSIMSLIRREEIMMDYLFAASRSVITVLYLRNKGAFDGLFNKIKNLKGVKAINRMKIFNAQSDPQNTFISQVLQQVDIIISGRNASHDVANTVTAATSTMDTAIRREAHNLKFAEANNKSFDNSMMLKFITGSFTATDKLMLQKMIGRDDFQAVPLDVDELNKINEFMFVKDSSGKNVALTKAMMSLINAFGSLK